MAAKIDNTPQAKDDAVAGIAGRTVVFDVMSNDLGGNAKHLYSVNQAQPGTVATAGTSAMGGTVAISGDKVSYVATGAAFNRLAAGQTAVDTFSYTIQMGNGALSVATVSVTITGMNDAPVITGTVTGTASGTALVTLDAFGRASDADAGAALTVTGLPTLPAGVTYDAATHSFTLNPGNAAYASLAAGETGTVTVNYLVSDGTTSTPASVAWTITGSNDAPVVSGAVVGAATQGGLSTVNALGNASDVDHGATLSVVGVPATLPAGVTYDAATHSFTLDSGAASYSHLAAGQTQVVTVSYGVTDGTATTAQTVSWTVTGANDAPVVAAALTGAAAEGSAPSTVNALAGASDLDDGATLSVTNLPSALPAGVTYDAATHSFSLDASNPGYEHLGAGQTQQVTVSFGVSDGTVTTPQTVTWTVTGANDAPTVSAALTGAASEGGVTTVNALGGASDVDDGTTLSVVNVPGALPAGVTYDAATHSFSLNGSDASYNHLAAGQTQTVSVSFGVSDGTVTTPQTVTWTVTGANDAPTVAAALTAAAAEGTAPSTVDALGGSSDVDDGTTLSVVGVSATLPAGVTYDAATHSFTLDSANPSYNHLAAGQTETVSVSFGVSDGTVTTPQTVTWTVTGANDAPTVIAALAGSAGEGAAASTVDALSGAGDLDDGAALTVVNVPGALPAGVTYDAATHSFSLNGSDASYNHLAAGQTQTVTVTFGVSDGTVTTPQSVTWTVTGANDAPTVVAALTGAAAEGAAPSTVDALGGASDVDDATTLSVVDVPGSLPAGVTYDAATHSFSLDASNTAYNHLGAGQSTPVTVSFGVSDGTVTTPQTVTWTVTGANDAPVVAAALTGAAADGAAPTTVDALGGASDVDDATTLSVVNVPATLPAGVTYDAATHSFTLDGSNAAYDHLPGGQSTVVTVSYGVSDGTATTPQTLSWTVTGANDAPTVTAALTGAAAEGAAPSTVDALGGASDVDDGATLSVVNVPGTLPAGVTYNAATHSFSLDPAHASYNHLAAGVTQNVSVAFGVSDGTATTPQTVTWTVTGANDAPTVTAAVTGSVAEGATATLNALAGASDVDDAAVLSVTNVPATLPAGVSYDAATKSFSLDAANAAYNHLAAGATQVVSVTYGVSDGTATTSQTATWTVTGVNDAPVVSGPLSVAATEGVASAAVSAISNASDPDDGAVLQVLNNALPPGVAYGSASRSFALDTSNAVFNNLAAGETRVVTVDYSISDGTVAAPTSISWTVTGVNDAPVVSSAIPDLQVGPYSAISYTLPAGTFTDVDAGATLTYSTSPLPSWLTFNAATQTFTGTPTLGNVGDYSVAVTAKDAANASVSDTFMLKVVDAPFSLNGGSGAETLSGGAFGDTISASLGADRIDGGGGADNINADAGGVTGSTIGLGIPVSADLTSVAYGYLTRPGGTLVNGLGSVTGLSPAAGHPAATFGENVLQRDDDSYLLIPTNVLDDAFPDGLNFFGTFYNSLFINNNGSVSFGAGIRSYSPSAFPVAGLPPQIAAYWADVDTRSTTPWAVSTQTGVLNGAPVYGQAGHYSPAGNSTGSNLVYYDVDPVNHVLTITWDDVGVFDRGPAASTQVGLQPNSFQMQIIDEGNGDFDVIFRYETVSWLTGSASNANPQAGFDSGDGVHYYQVPGSRTLLMGDLESQTNTIPANPGVMQFYVRGGGVGYDDTITGGAGADTLEGGGGADRFVFNSRNEGSDRITDFYTGVDEIAVSAAGFGGGLVAGAAVRFLSAADHATATLAGGGYFIFETSTKILWWDANGGFGSDAVSLAVLPGATLTGADIVVF